VVSVVAVKGIDVTGHRSRIVTGDDLAAADLILGLAREHVRHAAVLLPEAWPRVHDPRACLPGPPGRRPRPRRAAWRLADPGRRRLDLLGSHPADDVADPAGGPPRGYQATADLLDQLTRDLVELGWPNSGPLLASPRSVRNKGL